MNILVTGASRGVGLEICRVLLNEGHHVYAVSRTVTLEFRSLQNDYPNNIYFKSVDLAETDLASRVIFKSFITNEIPLHAFVNNAAEAYDDIITNINLKRLSRMFSTNVFTPFLMTKYALRNMLVNKIQGSIVHISSISAHTGYKGLAMYASTKGAIEAFSKNTAREWGEKGIRSNVVVPGFMDTHMSETLNVDQKNRIYKRTSLKLPTDIASVANTVAFLISNNSRSITGQNIHVDAGTI